MNLKRLNAPRIWEAPPLKAMTFKAENILLFMFSATAVLLLIYRLFLMWILPLLDVSEARYGEIARLTVMHGFWLMPHMDMNTPFFAKPPLSTWVASASMFMFGINEFAARLPSLLASILAAWVAIAFAAAFKIKNTWLVLPVLASCPLFFFCAGAVMTDAVQVCVISAALYFAWRAIEPAIDPETDENRAARRRWRLAFWAMVGAGALSKGLANWALICMPLIAYAFVARQPVELFKLIFDWRGIVIAACIFVPWYAAAEYYYPGFLNYFIVGEHFSRFLVPGWKGDRYGFAHHQALGMIWFLWVASVFPWFGVFVTQLYAYFKKKSDTVVPLERFLWCATLTPLLFFSFAHNIIVTYCLTSIVPFSVLVVRWIEHASEKTFKVASIGIFLFSLGALLCSSLIIKNVNANSDRNLIAEFNRKTSGATPLVYRTKPWYSSSFYSRGNLSYQADTSQEALTNSVVAPAFVVVDSASVGTNKVYFQNNGHALIHEKKD